MTGRDLRFRKSLTAEHYQRAGDPVRAMADAAAPRVARSFGGALIGARRLIDPNALTAAVAARNWLGAVDAFDAAAYGEALRAPAAQIGNVAHSLHQAGGEQIAALMIRKDATTFASDPYSFQLYGQDIEAAIRGYQDALISNLTGEARQTVFDAVVAAVRAGAGPDEVAAIVRDVIGLNDRLATAVTNYRAALEQGNTAAALSRQLRDDTADAEVRAGSLSQERIDALVDAYAERALDHRASVIAQTECARAANYGLRQAYQQAVARGTMPEAAVRRYWRLATIERACPICVAIATSELHVRGIPIGADFMSAGAPIGDPPAHVGCRCSIEVRVNVDMLPVRRAA